MVFLIPKKFNMQDLKLQTDITGLKFGKLTAIKFVELRPRFAIRKLVPFWLFKYDCGNEKIIYKHDVVSNNTLPC